MSFAECPRLAAAERDHPDLLLDARRIAARVGVLATQLEITASGVDDALGVRRPGKLGSLLPVILFVGRELARPVRTVGARLRHKDVPYAAGAEHPGHFSSGWRRGQFTRERRAHHLFDGERLLLRGSAGKAGHNRCQDEDTTDRHWVAHSKSPYHEARSRNRNRAYGRIRRQQVRLNLQEKIPANAQRWKLFVFCNLLL